MKVIFQFVTIVIMTCAAMPTMAQGQGDIQIRSTYLNAAGNGFGNEITWIFHRAAKSIIEVKRKGNEKEVLLFLYYDKEGLLEKVTNTGFVLGTGKKNTEKRPKGSPYFLSDGFPVPFDDLDIKDSDARSAVYQKEAGGMKFAYILKRTVMNIPVEVAVAAGMIEKGTVKEKTAPALKLYSVYKSDGTLLVKQLWSSDGNWWLFEETPFRKSWRLR
jgi:hypothetical protein